MKGRWFWIEDKLPFGGIIYGFVRDGFQDDIMASAVLVWTVFSQAWR